LAGCYRGIDEFEALHEKLFKIFRRDRGTLGDESQMRIIGQEVLAWGHEYLRVQKMPLGPPCFIMLRFLFQGGAISQLDWFYDAAGLLNQMD
jgi:hypothetical protein